MSCRDASHRLAGRSIDRAQAVLPTRGEAYGMPVVESLLQVARLGSAWVLWLLIALSVLSLATVAERLWFFQANRRRGGDALRDRVLAALDADDLAGARAALRESRTVEGQVVAEAFRFAEGGPAAFEAALDAELARARHALDRGLNLLGTIGNNAPFIGLLGTVIGVIVAFVFTLVDVIAMVKLIVVVDRLFLFLLVFGTPSRRLDRGQYWDWLGA